MNQIQDRSEKKVFHQQDFVLWHYHIGKHSLPIPGVVVRQEEQKAIIRVRIDEKLQELAVDPAELIER